VHCKRAAMVKLALYQGDVSAFVSANRGHVGAVAINHTIIGAKHAALYRHKSKPLIKALSSRIPRKRIDKHGFYCTFSKAPFECKVHHLCSISSAEVGFLAYQGIDSAKVCFDLAPVVRFLPCRIDDLDHADRVAAVFCNEDFPPIRAALQLALPVQKSILAGGRDDMRLGGPVTQRGQIGRGGALSPDW
jgi:hypothetical protein